MGDSKFRKSTSTAAGKRSSGISSRVASPTSVLLQEEAGMMTSCSSWEVGQLPASQEGQLVALKMQHGSAAQQADIGCSTQPGLAGINIDHIGRESCQILKEALELELRSDWEVMGTSTTVAAPMTTSGDATQAGVSGNFFPPASNDPCGNSMMESLGVSSSGARAISKRRPPRASRRLPTTVLEASCTDFRDMVQKLTGVPISSTSLRPNTGSELQALIASVHSMVRPQPQRANLETTSSSQSSYLASLSNGNTFLPQFHVNSDRVLQKPTHPDVAAEALLRSVSRGGAQAGANPDFAQQSYQLSDNIHAAGSFFPGYNYAETENIIASLYGRSSLMQARSSNTRSSPAAAAPTTSSSTARASWTDSAVAPCITFSFTMPNPLAAEQFAGSSTSAGASTDSRSAACKFVDHEQLLAGFKSASTSYNHTLAPETKQEAAEDFASSRSYHTCTVESAECALAEISDNLAQDHRDQQQQLLFNQMDFWLQSDQLTAGMRVV